MCFRILEGVYLLNRILASLYTNLKSQPAFQRMCFPLQLNLITSGAVQIAIHHHHIFRGSCHIKEIESITLKAHKDTANRLLSLDCAFAPAVALSPPFHSQPTWPVFQTLSSWAFSFP